MAGATDPRAVDGGGDDVVGRAGMQHHGSGRSRPEHLYWHLMVRDGISLRVVHTNHQKKRLRLHFILFRYGLCGPGTSAKDDDPERLEDHRPSGRNRVASLVLGM